MNWFSFKMNTQLFFAGFIPSLRPKSVDQEHTTQVVIRCNKCGNKISFFPMRIIATRPCECGNDDWGYGGSRGEDNWWHGKFGSFTLLQARHVVYSIKAPIGEGRWYF